MPVLVGEITAAQLQKVAIYEQFLPLWGDLTQLSNNLPVHPPPITGKYGELANELAT